MSGNARDDRHGRRDEHDELGTRRRASWGRRDDDERAEERGRDERVGGRGLDEHEETQSHAGNGTVNHGPEEQGPTKGQGLEGHGPKEPGRLDGQGDSGSDDLGSGESGSDDLGSGSGASGSGDSSAVNGRESGGRGSGGQGLGAGHGPGLGLAGADSDELALRNLLHQAVAEIEPRDGTLEHLRRAVPARRARKRQAVVGMAAAALFIGTAVPALVHVSNSTGSEINPSAVGNGSQTQGGSGESKGESGKSGSAGGSSSAPESGKNDDKGKGDKGKGESNGSTGGAEPTPATETIPACTATQLSSSASAGAPDSVGAVYGTFRVSNISGASCTVAGAGGVSTTPQGAADGSRISVVPHVAGDAAGGLPDPALSPSQLVLAPGTSYEVQFAWVPSEPCPTGDETTGGTSGGGEPSPDPTPTEEVTDGGTTTDGTNSMTTQLFTEDGAVDGSVLVSHTAEGGVTTATTTVSNACAGTVYRTGLLATS